MLTVRAKSVDLDTAKMLRCTEVLTGRMLSRRDAACRVSADGGKTGRDGASPVPTEETRKTRHLRSRSPSACFMTWPPTSAIDVVSGMSFGQISTQFWA